MTESRTEAKMYPCCAKAVAEEAAERLGVGRTMVYALVHSGDIESIAIGRLRRIPIDALDEFVGRLRAVTRSHDTADRD